MRVYGTTGSRAGRPASRDPVVGRTSDGHEFVARTVDYPPGYRQAPHAHDSASVTLLIAGRIRETVGRTVEVGTSLSAVVKPTGVVHANEVGPRGARTIQILLGDHSLIDDPGPGLGPWRWIHAGPGIREFLAFEWTLRSAERVSEAEDQLFDLLGGMAVGDPRPRRDPPGWLRRAREALDDRVASRVRVADIAEEAGVHPVSLTRAFRRHYGVSVSGYRGRARLRRAAAAIERTDRDLSRIAHASGYADHAHMCREIRRATGRTPTEIRCLARRA